MMQVRRRPLIRRFSCFMGQRVAVSEFQALVDHSTLGVPADLQTHKDSPKAGAGPPLFSSCWNTKSGE